jgi:hypothetical protein
VAFFAERPDKQRSEWLACHGAGRAFVCREADLLGASLRIKNAVVLNVRAVYFRRGRDQEGAPMVAAGSLRHHDRVRWCEAQPSAESRPEGGHLSVLSARHSPEAGA